jgi:hypothetical protein
MSLPLHGRLRSAAYRLLADIARDNLKPTDSFATVAADGWRVTVSIRPADDVPPVLPAEPTEPENTILEAIAGDTLSGEEIALRAGYSYDHVRRVLPRMVRRGLLVHTSAGYRALPRG